MKLRTLPCVFASLIALSLFGLRRGPDIQAGWGGDEKVVLKVAKQGDPTGTAVTTICVGEELGLTAIADGLDGDESVSLTITDNGTSVGGSMISNDTLVKENYAPAIGNHTFLATASFSHPNRETTPSDDSDPKNVTVVAVDKIRYKQADDTYADVPDPLYIRKGDSIDFKALANPSDAPWPDGKPEWGGSSGASGTGSTISVTFNTVSTSSTDFKTVTAECGNTVECRIIVDDDGTLRLTDKTYNGSKSDDNNDDHDPDPAEPLAVGIKSLGSEADPRAKIKFSIINSNSGSTYNWALYSRGEPPTSLESGTFNSANGYSKDKDDLSSGGYYVRVTKEGDGDYRRRIDFDVMGVNLEVVGFSPPEFVTEDDEESKGAFVLVNNNFDEQNRNASGRLQTDNLPTNQPAGHRIVPADTDLKDAALTLQGTPGVEGKWKLTFPDKIKVWKPDSQSGQWVAMTSGSVSDEITLPMTVNFKIEGIGPSDSIKDADLKAAFIPTGQSTTFEDHVKLTIVEIKIVSPTRPYVSSMAIDNLAGCWPIYPVSNFAEAEDTEIKLQIVITPAVSSLPPEFRQWSWASSSGVLRYTVAPPESDYQEFWKINPGMGYVTATFSDIAVTKSVWIGFPDVGTESEAAVFAQDPWMGAMVYDYGTDAEEYANTLINSIGAERANAIQHSYWNATVTWMSNSSTAERFTKAHEYSNRFGQAASGSQSAYAVDSTADLHNNLVGQEVGDALKSLPPPTPTDEIKAALNQKLESGDLWILHTDDFLVIKSNDNKIIP